MEIPSDGVVLVDFFTTWCGPCRAMDGIVGNVRRTFGERLSVMKVDCEQFPDLSDKFQVRSVPTVVVLKDGTEQSRKVGMCAQEELAAAISSAL